jgi:hypothetical protein
MAAILVSGAMKARYTFALLAKAFDRTNPTVSNERIATHAPKPSIKWYITHIAWMIPGISPNSVSKMLMQKSAPHPRRSNTASGGRNMANITRQTSLVKVVIHN